jgi:tape measure domain-containing protein
MTLLDFDVIWRDQGAAKGLKDLAAGSKTAERGFGDMASSADKAAAIIKRAQLDQAGATRKVAIEEAKLKELRDSGKAKASQILAAEDRLAHARQKVADATETAERATKGLTTAERQEEAAGKKASDAAGKSAHSFGLMAAGAHKAKDGFNVLKGAVSVAGGMAIAKLATAGASGVQFGLSVAAGNEQAQISFETMLGSATKAQDFLGKLQQFAASTPFEFPELQTAASSLISAGINADKVIPIMRNLGDVTSGMGTGSEGVKRATVALQQMNAAGKISGEDLAQLRDAGIPVYDLLAKATGKSKAAIVDLANKGKLGKKELQQMMDALAGPAAQAGLGRFSGLMDKQSQSLTGMWSTIKDTAGQGLATAIGPAIPLIKSAMGGVSGSLSSVSKWVTTNKGSLGEFFGAIGSSLKSFSAIAGSWLKPFTSSLTGGKNTFKSFADFLGTHQEDITRGLIAGARFTISFAEALGIMASAGLRAFAFLMDAQANMTAQMLGGFKLVIHGAALAFGWIPGVGDKLKTADEKFDGFATGVVTGMHKAADGARGLADGIDTKMTPALKAARAGLDKMAKQQIWDAQKRDQAERARIAIEGIGTKANGSQIKLKKFSDITKLSGTEQAALKGRLSDASHALGDQLTAMKKAHAGQGELTKAWKTGRDRLYDEFKQMGLSKTEAGRLADKYAGVKPKVSTKFEQPGMKKAKDDADTLKRKYGDVPGKKTIKIDFDTSVDGMNARLYSSHGKMALQMSAAQGGVLPGYTPGRDVHSFFSPTGGRLNLSGGEAIMVPEWTRAIGGPGEVARQNRAARRGENFASGGVLGEVVSGGTSAVVNSGAIALASVMKRLSAAGLVGGKGYVSALNYVKAHSGHPYQFATIWDCSGLMGSVEAIIKGKSPNQRYWSTPAFAGGPAHAQGFTRNKRSAFMIGVNPSPGKFGHTAGTLNGVNVESSGGVGVHYGPSARGWNNAMFPLHYGLAKGGVIPIPKRGGDLPFDTLDPRGKHYDPRTAQLLGFAEGGVVSRPSIIRAGEKGRERVLSERQTSAFENLVPLLSRGGGAVVNNYYTVNAPNYVGSQNELVSALVKLNGQGRLQVIKGR